MKRILGSNLKLMLLPIKAVFLVLPIAVFAAPPVVTLEPVIDINDIIDTPIGIFAADDKGPGASCPEELVELHDNWAADPTYYSFDDQDAPDFCQRSFIDSDSNFLNITVLSGYEHKHINFYFVNDGSSNSFRSLMTAAETEACALEFACTNLIVASP